MYPTSVSYYDNEGQFDLDDLIRSVVSRHGGEEIGRGYCVDCGRREFAFDLPDEDSRAAAWGELMQAAAGDFASTELSCSHEPEDDATTELLITFDPGQPWIPRKIASLLTDDLCSGWSHLGGEEHAISVWCRSPQAGASWCGKFRKGRFSRSCKRVPLTKKTQVVTGAIPTASGRTNSTVLRWQRARNYIVPGGRHLPRGDVL